MTNQPNNKHTKQSLLTNNDDFMTYMQEIDDKLAAEGIKISARSIAAGGKISEDLNCDIAWKEPLGEKIFAWYKQRYGDRLKIDPTIGKLVVKINQDPFLVKFPLIYGTRQVNLLTFIQNITPNLLNSLPKEELDKLANLIIKYFKAYIKIVQYGSIISYGDIDNTVNQIMNQNPNYGLSKWASLQLAEKALKAYITKKGGNPPRTHNIANLVSIANTKNFPNVPATMLNNIQCSPDVRYNNTVTLNEAIDAHQASLELCEIVVSNYL